MFKKEVIHLVEIRVLEISNEYNGEHSISQNLNLKAAEQVH